MSALGNPRPPGRRGGQEQFRYGFANAVGEDEAR
jgi:hypothetical protein